MFNGGARAIMLARFLGTPIQNILMKFNRPTYSERAMRAIRHYRLKSVLRRYKVGNLQTSRVPKIVLNLFRVNRTIPVCWLLGTQSPEDWPHGYITCCRRIRGFRKVWN